MDYVHFIKKITFFFCLTDKQIFHCFGCGVGGNVFHFVSKIENLNFKETVEMLADRCGVSLPLLDNEGDSKTALLKSKVYEINTIAANFYHENLYKPLQNRHKNM
ncbi:MAG: CHC2 zinc finger domain-containing protein [Clostridia bacterium]